MEGISKLPRPLSSTIPSTPPATRAAIATCNCNLWINLAPPSPPNRFKSSLRTAEVARWPSETPCRCRRRSCNAFATFASILAPRSPIALTAVDSAATKWEQGSDVLGRCFFGWKDPRQWRLATDGQFSPGQCPMVITTADTMPYMMGYTTSPARERGLKKRKNFH